MKSIYFPKKVRSGALLARLALV